MDPFIKGRKNTGVVLNMKKILIGLSISFVIAGVGYLSFFKNSKEMVSTQPLQKIISTNGKDSSTPIQKQVNASIDNSASFVPAKETVLNNVKPMSESENNTSNEKDIESKKPQSANYGLTEGVDPKANAQVASVAEALKNTKFPERLSPLIQPKPFDRAKFEKDPQAYLNVIEPGRVFQSKNPDNEVVIIQRISEPFVTIQQNDKTILKVKALPQMPVTFTSFDLGAFQNQLTSITVQADKDGFAQATFIGTEGTLADCNILASCPETSGRIKFVISVTKNNLFSQ